MVEAGSYVFLLAPTWLIAVLCFAIASANVYLSCRKPIKAWAKRLKALNWIFLGSVYVYMSFWDYGFNEVRVLIRIAMAFLIAGEAAYHTDTFQDMIDSAVVLAKRLTKHG
jgi:hypothetical protein